MLTIGSLEIKRSCKILLLALVMLLSRSLFCLRIQNPHFYLPIHNTGVKLRKISRLNFSFGYCCVNKDQISKAVVFPQCYGEVAQCVPAFVILLCPSLAKEFAFLFWVFMPLILILTFWLFSIVLFFQIYFLSCYKNLISVL